MGVLNGIASVADVQTKLKGAGYDPGAIDNAWGPNTEAAVRRYQADKGLTVDGIVGNQTWGSLSGGGGSPAPAPSAPAAPAAQPNQLQDVYNQAKQKFNGQTPTDQMLRDNANRAAQLQINPQIEALKRATEQNSLNLTNQQNWTKNQYADTATDLQKLYDQQRASATDRMFGRGLGRSGLLEKQMQGYDTAQADQLNKAYRERDLKLGEIASQLNLGQKQAGEQEQSLIGQRGLIESQQYDNLSQQAREQGNTNLARLFDMASQIAQQDWQRQQAAAEQSRWQSEFGLKQQELAQSAAIAAANRAEKAAKANKFDQDATDAKIRQVKSAYLQGASHDELAAEIDGMIADGTASKLGINTAQLLQALESNRPGLRILPGMPLLQKSH